MRRLAFAPLIGLLVLLSLAGSAAAKGNALAELDTPIPPGAKPGSEIDLGWRAWVPDVDGDWPFAGSPVFIRLTSPDGSASTEVLGVENPRGSGHYLATIEVPAGGVGLVQVGLFGESCINGVCSRSDILFALPAAQRVPMAVAVPAGPIDPPLPQLPSVRPEARVMPPPARNVPIEPVVPVAAGALALLAIGLLWRVRSTHGPAGVAAPAHAGLRRQARTPPERGTARAR